MQVMDTSYPIKHWFLAIVTAPLFGFFYEVIFTPYNESSDFIQLYFLFVLLGFIFSFPVILIYYFTFLLLFYLTFCLTFYLTFYLTFITFLLDFYYFLLDFCCNGCGGGCACACGGDSVVVCDKECCD